ncbi:MAG: 2OG-Fe(II) oxygenase [Jatrophihabitans sp.]
MTKGPTRPTDLSLVLANRRWVRRCEPFPHVVAQDVFTDEFYAELAAEFRRIEGEHPEAFRRDMPGYDAAGSQLDEYRSGPLGLFLGREWHDLMTAIFGVDATGDATATLHHHEPGGASGWPHNDLNPGWFANPPAGPAEVRAPSDGPVSYHKGDRPDGVSARETIRAVSMLFYLANPPWSAGDGGETALYADSVSRQPAATVPPVNNSLVMFECTPFCWHGFLTNPVKPRNSIVMWVHRAKADVEARWGANNIAYW